MNQKNKNNETNKGKSETPKKAHDTHLNNMSNNNNVSQKSCNVIINNNQLKNDTYESVCSPEDTMERTKVAQRHSIAVNGSNTISTSTINNSNSSMVSSCNSNDNNNRLLKRVISAPAGANDAKGNLNCHSMQ